MAHFASAGDDQMEWEEVKSANGNVFLVGRPKSDTKDDKTTKDVNVAGKPEFGIGVNWPVEGRWKDTTGEIKDEGGIQRYSLKIDEKWGFTYLLEFNNTKNYDFWFYDRTGDKYQCNCFVRGDHSVRYNSSKPTILYVTGA